MGLTCSHGAFDGAYSAFNQFRQFIAKATGGSFPPHENKDLSPNHWYFGDGYNNETHKGLYEFLTHSDCDGEISPEICVEVYKDLEALMPNIEKLAETEPIGSGHLARDGGYVQVTKEFIKGCKLASLSNEPLEFR